MDAEDRITQRDRYHARSQLVAAIIGALIAGVLGGREWKERSTERDMAASQEAMKQLKAELAERTGVIEQLTHRLDAQEAELRRLHMPPSPSGGVPTNTSSSAAPASELAVVAAEDVAGITLSLKGCRLSNSVVSCDLVVVNHDRDRSLEICTPCYGNRSRLVDSEGTEYQPEAAYLGSDYKHRPKAVLASEVPMRAGIRFNGIQSPFVNIKLLEIGIRVGFASDQSVQFHDITLQ